MTKINLMSIMEALDQGDDETAQARIHEWFVEQGRIATGVSQPVSEEPDDSTDITSTFVKALNLLIGEMNDSKIEYADDPEESIFTSSDYQFYADVKEICDTQGPEAAQTHWLKNHEDSDQKDFLYNVVGLSDDEAEALFELGRFTDEGIDQNQPTFEDLVADISESFQGLETVSDKLQNVEGAQVGEQGKVPVNTKSTLPSKKGDKRVGGEPVEIKGKGHTGHALEKAPKVKDVKVRGPVGNGAPEPKKVSPEGDKSAVLNKVDGTINTQSPISGKGQKGLKK